jgi:hypothetical protein
MGSAMETKARFSLGKPLPKKSFANSTMGMVRD